MGFDLAGSAQGFFDPGKFTQYYTPPPTTYANQGLINQQIQQGMASGNQAAPQMDATQQAQFRAMQMQQAQRLQGIASGQQQGAGELATQRQVANAMAAQQAQARMARGGGNAGMAMRNSASNSAGIGLSGAGQSQQAALQDQQMAQGQLTGALNSGRTGDLSLAGQNANLQQQQYGLNTQRQLGYMGQETGMDQAQMAAALGQYQAQMGMQNQSQGGAMSGIGAMMAMSDERVKTDITDGDSDIDDMLDRLVAKTYRYKDEKHGKGVRTGIMAQDAMRSKRGASFVVPVRDGLALDVNKALSAALASTARLNARLRKLEGKAA